MERTSNDVLDTFAEFGHPIDVKLMAQELRARRSADLTVEEVEAVRELISYTSSDLPASSRIAYQAIAKIRAAAMPLCSSPKGNEVPMAQLGIDYADTDTINKPGVAGFTQAKSAGSRIVIPRGVFGRPANGQTPVYLDAYWSRDKDDIVAAGLTRSSYLFVCVPTKAQPDTPSPEVQVAAFYGYVQLDKPKVGTRPHDMVPFFDVEMASDVLSADAYYDWILKVAKLLRSAFGAWPGMYTSDRVWTEVLKNHAAGQLANCPLWIAKPWPWATGTTVHLDGAPGYNPTTLPEFGDTTNWIIYQYAGDALGMPGFSPGATDTNRVNLVKRGAKGTIVKWIQARAGNLTIDGDFGPKTETRIKELQDAYTLTVDGIVGADTFTLLTWLNPAPL